ncbi:MAG: hypothetical protein HY965_06870 [Ignavibacteriales bacterium]|nr:hypothetical protein [Ignavibacteriales bacterium]
MSTENVKRVITEKDLATEGIAKQNVDSCRIDVEKLAKNYAKQMLEITGMDPNDPDNVSTIKYLEIGFVGGYRHGWKHAVNEPKGK